VYHEALVFPRKAKDRGYAAHDGLKNPDLESLHGDPKFEAIVAEVKKRIDEE